MNDAQHDGWFHADENRARGARGLQIVGGDVNAGLALHALAQLRARFARDDLFRGAVVAQDQAANHRASEFARANEGEAIPRV